MIYTPTIDALILRASQNGPPPTDYELGQAAAEAKSLIVSAIDSFHRIAGALEQISLNTHPTMK